MSENISALSRRRGLDKNLITAYEQAASDRGSVSEEAVRAIAKDALLGEAVVYGAASFYDFLKSENRGKRAYVCEGTACKMAGTQPKVERALEDQFGAEKVGAICCLGRCHEAGAFHVDGQNYSGDALARLEDIARGSAQDVHVDTYRVAHLGEPLQTSDFGGLDVFEDRVRKLLASEPDHWLEEMLASDLRGRGGAGFPAGVKWRTTREVEADEKFVVCNADEGDPGAYTDRYIMEKQPERLFLGMMMAGYVAGANTGVLYTRMEYPESIETARSMVERLEAAGLLGPNILGSGFAFSIKVVGGAGAYICGEETALLASIEGARPEVRVRPPFPALSGLFRQPTVLNNVETFVLAESILDIGGAAFSQIGTEASKGTKLVSLDAGFKTPGVYEVPMGTPLRTVIDELGGGFRYPVKALQVGGPLGGVVPASAFDQLTVDFETFENEGFLLGHAGVVTIPADFPLLEYVEHLFAFTAAESCGKCFPCRIGSTRGEEMFAKARAGGYAIDRALLNDLLDTMELGSLCALGGGVPLPIRNILEHFEPELAAAFVEEA